MLFGAHLKVGSKPLRIHAAKRRPVFVMTGGSAAGSGLGFWTLTAMSVSLLIVSNVFMTFAWYGHLKFKTSALWLVILISWGIAFFEYCLQVPANRIGHGHFSAVELKTIQEVITLSVFVCFSFLYLGEPVKWNHIAEFAIICVGVFVIFKKW
jgi:uncharacterized protein (DUF486 family)